MKELEYSIINYLLINPERIPEASSEINKYCFTDKNARFCFIAMIGLFEKQKPIGQFEINNELKSNRMIPIAVGVFDEIENVFDTFDDNFHSHLETLFNASIKRRLEETLNRNLKHDSHSTDLTVLDNVINELSDLKMQSNRIEEQTIEVQMAEVEKEAQEMISGNYEPVVFGLPDLDKKFMFNFTDLVIVAGRPGMGKSAFVISALEWFNHKGYNPVMISLEMSANQILWRMLCSLMQVSMDDVRRGKITNEKLQLAKKEVLRKMKMSTIFDKEFHIKQIESIIQKKAMQGCRAVVIDYLGLIEGGEGLNQNNKVGDITRRLKQHAKKHNIAVILLSQLSRKVEERRNKRPMLADLRDSGSIEQDADSVLFLYREGYYNDDFDQNIAEVGIAKNRHGGTGVAEETFRSYSGTFKNKLS